MPALATNLPVEDVLGASLYSPAARRFSTL
jgi:hypothetical protein